jgi:hypothetical protein
LLAICWSELASTAEKAEAEVPPGTGPVPAASLDGLCGGVTTIVGMSAWPCDDVGVDVDDGCGRGGGRRKMKSVPQKEKKAKERKEERTLGRGAGKVVSVVVERG